MANIVTDHWWKYCASGLRASFAPFTTSCISPTRTAQHVCNLGSMPTCCWLCRTIILTAGGDCDRKLTITEKPKMPVNTRTTWRGLQMLTNLPSHTGMHMCAYVRDYVKPLDPERIRKNQTKPATNSVHFRHRHRSDRCGVQQVQVFGNMYRYFYKRRSTITCYWNVSHLAAEMFLHEMPSLFALHELNVLIVGWHDDIKPPPHTKPTNPPTPPLDLRMRAPLHLHSTQ